MPNECAVFKLFSFPPAHSCLLYKARQGCDKATGCGVPFSILARSPLHQLRSRLFPAHVNSAHIHTHVPKGITENTMSAEAMEEHLTAPNLRPRPNVNYKEDHASDNDELSSQADDPYEGFGTDDSRGTCWHASALLQGHRVRAHLTRCMPTGRDEAAGPRKRSAKQRRSPGLLVAKHRHRRAALAKKRKASQAGADLAETAGPDDAGG